MCGLAFLAMVSSTECKPDFDDTTSFVAGPRVLAIRSEVLPTGGTPSSSSAMPAEASPGTEITYTALLADEAHTLDPAALGWASCRARKPIADLGSVSTDCLVPSSPDLVPLGQGLSVTGTLFTDACRLFGPNPPPPVNGEASGRPVDPDSTGGFYVPLRVRIVIGESDVYVVGQTRVVCDPAGLTQEQLVLLKQRYTPNLNPTIDSLSIVTPTGETSVPPIDSSSLPPSPPTAVASRSRLALRVRWPLCGDPGSPCSGAEPYVAIDPSTHALVDRRESMRVSWFTDGGGFDIDHTGRTEAESSGRAIDSDNGLTLPTGPTTVHIWIVLRDDRGGTTWQTYALDVGP